jgi:hypothetical protein
MKTIPMLSDLFFMGLLLFGLLSGAVICIVLVIGLFRKSRKTIWICLLALIVPLCCIYPYFLYYNSYLPELKEDTLIQFSGIYCVDQSKSRNADTDSFRGKTFHLTLYKDKTFKMDSIPHMSFSGTGKWSTDGVDDQFNFYTINGSLIATASPFSEINSEEIIFNLYDPKEDYVLSRLNNKEIPCKRLPRSAIAKRPSKTWPSSKS